MMTLWIGNGAVLKSSSQWQLLRIAPLPIHKVIINAIFYDAKNGIYLLGTIGTLIYTAFKSK